MNKKPSFGQEVANLLYASEGSPISTCMQCGTCSGTCPSVEFMDYSPREIVAMVGSGMRDEVLDSNTFWFCASCHHCTVKCPRGIPVAELMYGLKRYSMWVDRYPEDLIGPAFSQRFVRTIARAGRLYEPALAPAFIFREGLRGFLRETRTALGLLRKGRLPLMPTKINRLKAFQRMVQRIVPIGDEE